MERPGREQPEASPCIRVPGLGDRGACRTRGGSLVSAIAFDLIPEGKALTTPISRCDRTSERVCSW
jgi:hypothetical protein